MLKEKDIIKQIENYLSDGDELIGFFSAKTTPGIFMTMVTPFAPAIFDSYIIAITKKGYVLHKVNTLFTKFIDYLSFDFVDADSVKFGWGLTERLVKISLKDGRYLKFKAMAIGETKLTKDIENYIKSKI